MYPLVSPADHGRDEAVAFLAELVRLESKVREVNQQLDRVEAELQDALGELARVRFEGYR
jgi:uncharacterized coiled-coil DUF342 family protein